MIQAEAESVIRTVVHDWADAQPGRANGVWHPTWDEFKDWLLFNFPTVMDFASQSDHETIAKAWFDEELSQRR